MKQNTRGKISKKLSDGEKISTSKKLHLSDDDVKQIIKLYTEERLPLWKCGEKFNIPKWRVAEILRENNISVRTNTEAHSLVVDDTLVKQIVNYYDSGHTINECRDKFGLKRSSTYKVIKENTTLRSSGEHAKGKPRTEQVKEKISKKNKGHKVNPNVTKNLLEHNKNMTPEQIKMRVSKAFLTRKLNGNIKYSQPEEDLYKKLLKENVNKTIYRQYKDNKRYPYYCDYYIKEDDLFIELNAHWTHGGHPFNKDNPEDIELLNKWKEKAKTSEFYKTAIEVWTIRDPEKQACAKKNKLNYKVIY